MGDDNYWIKKLENQVVYFTEIPDYAKTKAVWHYMVRSKPILVLEIPYGYITNELLRYVAQTKKYSLIGKLPAAVLCRIDCRSLIEIQPNLIRFLDPEFHTFDNWILAYSKNKHLDFEFPKAFRDNEKYWEICIHHNCDKIVDCPPKFITKKLCLFAFNKNFSLITEFPKEMTNYDMWKKAVLWGSIFIHPKEMIRQIPKKFLDNKMVWRIIDSKPSFILEISDGYATPKHWCWAVEHSPHLLQFIPGPDYVTKEACCAAVKAKPDSLAFVPTKFITANFCIDLLSKKPSLAKYIPTEALNPDLCKIIILCLIKKLQKIKSNFLLRFIEGSHLVFIDNTLADEELNILHVFGN